MDLMHHFQQLGISLGLGLLVGLQRERSEPRLGGFRTFPLVTLLGTVSAQLAAAFGGWVVGAALLALAAVIVVADATKKANGADAGTTTEAAMLLMFCVGAYLAAGSAAVAVALGGGVAVLLHLKPEMHTLAKRMGDADFRAVMQFALITLVILPVLPDRAYGPYQVFNPHRVWLMVVLIVGMSLAGYVLYKKFGQRVGALLAGILGGLISSTVTTVSYSRRVATAPESVPSSALVIAIASAVVFVRIFAIVAIVAPGSVRQTVPPFLALFVALLAFVAPMLRTRRGEHAGMPAQGNPSELRPAVIFAVVFSVMLVAVAAAQANFGRGGLYVVGVLSGLTDMDAIALSTLQMVAERRVEADTAWRVVLSAALANVVFKAATVAVLGGRPLFRRLLPFFAFALAGGLAIVRFWPKL